MLLRETIYKTFDKNLEFFKQFNFRLYERICRFKPNDIKLAINNKQEVNFIYKNKLFYPISAIDLAKKETQNFINSPFKIQFNYNIEEVRENKTFFLDSYKNSLINILPNLDFKNSYNINTNNIPLMIVLGIKLGYHIEELVKYYNIKHLIIYETEFPFFYISLYTIDWEEIFKKVKTLDIHISNRFDSLMNNIRNLNFILIEHAFIYAHYDFNNILSNLLDSFKSIILEIDCYYIDEQVSITNSFFNLKNKVKVYLPKDTFIFDIPVFVIGAGPSLDNSIEVIKKYKDRVIVFSCGSAIQSLEKEQIVPDFHIELERSIDTYEKLQGLDKNYLKKIILIGSNTIPSETFNLFKDGFMYLKVNDSGSSIFPMNIPRLSKITPLVSNAALALILNLGFRYIYLLGIDLGYINPSYHHSKYNLSLDRNSKFYLKEDTNYKEIEGNFRDKVYTNGNFLLSKYFLESLINDYQNLKIYNCSDGVKVDKTYTLSVKNVFIKSDYSLIKNKTIESICEQFSNEVISDIDINETFEFFYKDTVYAIDNLIECIRDIKIENKWELVELFTQMNEFLITPLIRGTVLEFQFLIYSQIFREEDNTKLLIFLNKAFEIFIEFLKALKNDIINYFKELKVNLLGVY